MKNDGLIHWIDVVRGASGSLFNELCETSLASLKDNGVRETLAESVYNRVKESPGHIWSPENSKSHIATVVMVILNAL